MAAKADAAWRNVARAGAHSGWLVFELALFEQLFSQDFITKLSPVMNSKVEDLASVYHFYKGWCRF
jgi:hypothetical protein